MCDCMTTRSGTQYYHLTQAQSSAPMESSLETTLNALNEQLARLNDQSAQNQLTLTHINARLDHLEAQTPERTMRNTRLEAPTFDESLDPKVFLDWVRDMDQYFEEELMTEKRKIQFAKSRLIRRARLYWEDIERLVWLRYESPIATWRDMKLRLRERYVPISYHRKLWNQWQMLNQWNMTLSEYIAKFKDFVIRCDIDEPEAETIARFRTGLRLDLAAKLYSRKVNNLEHAYQVARDCEREPSLFESIKIPILNPDPRSSQTNPSQPDLSPPMICNEDEDEESSGPIEENEVQGQNYEEQLEEIKGDPELIGVVTIRENLESIPKDQPQEIVVPLKGYQYVFSDSCPEPESPFWNISNSSPPSWDVHHAIDMVPVIFNSYSRKTLWHLLGTKLRFTATYLLLCAKIFKTI